MVTHTSEEAKQKRRESRARWVAANPQADRDAKAAYAIRNREAILAKARAKTALAAAARVKPVLTEAMLLEKESLRLLKKRIAQKQYRLDNSAKVTDTQKRTYEKHRVARDAEKAAWARKNSARVLGWARQRQLAKFKRTPIWLTQDDHWMIQQAYELAALRTAMFGFSWHVDHVLPLRGKLVSGLHTPYNLQVIPGSENCRKGNRVELA